MKRGAKRPAVADSDPNPTDSAALRSKRVMEAPSFMHRAESSRHQHLMEGGPLDAKRAESARQHVRALNTQFASWVQLQLQNHPDELWEDGVKDYLSHASHLLEKFKDVVDWLRAEAAKSETTATAGFPVDHNRSRVNNGSASEINPSSSHSSDLSNSHGSGLFSISRASSSSGLPSSQNSGLFSFGQKTASSGLQSSCSLNSQTTGSFGISQKSAVSNLQSSGSSSSQSSGFFGFSQTPTSSSLQSSGFSGSQSSGLFSFSQMPPHSSSQCSGLASSQSLGFSSISQKPPNSSLQTLGLSSTQSSGFFSINQAPVLGGTQTFSAPAVVASGDADEENELEQPSSPSLRKTEEKGVIVVHEVKCKVYVKPDNPADTAWKDMGVGQLSIKCKEGADKSTKESKPTIVIRNDVGKILLNALIYPGIKINIKKNTIATIFHTSVGEQNGVEDGKSSVVARTYLLRLKNEDDTTKLADTIQDYTPSA